MRYQIKTGKIIENFVCAYTKDEYLEKINKKSGDTMFLCEKVLSSSRNVKRNEILIKTGNGCENYGSYDAAWLWVECLVSIFITHVVLLVDFCSFLLKILHYSSAVLHGPIKLYWYNWYIIGPAFGLMMSTYNDDGLPLA